MLRAGIRYVKIRLTDPRHLSLETKTHRAYSDPFWQTSRGEILVTIHIKSIH